jgi:hypothetical protein
MGRSGYDAGFRVRAVQLAEEIGYRRAESILGVSARAINTWKRWPLNCGVLRSHWNVDLHSHCLSDQNHSSRSLPHGIRTASDSNPN